MSARARFEESVIEEARARPLASLTDRDRVAFVVVGGSFVVVAFLLLAWLPSARAPAWWELVFFVGLYAFVSRLEYEVGIGSVVPTQLIFTPMLFVFPLGQVPLIVLSALVLASLVDIASGRLTPERFGFTAMDAWHTVGPVVVLGIAGERPPRLADAPIYALALLAQFAVELASFSARDWITRGVKPKAQLREMWRSAPIDQGATMFSMKEAGALMVYGMPRPAICFSTRYLLSKCGMPVFLLASATDE